MDKHQILKQYFGHTEFRRGQAELIDAILSGRDAFGIMPTGAGKSVCYQIPALMFEGVTLVISPLISLMKDQVNSLVQAGVNAAYLNSSLTAAQYVDVLRRAGKSEYKILYVTPERLTAPGFLRFAEKTKIAMVTVDETHCVSQWGQDFRPSYLKISEFIERLSYRPVMSAFTATATEEVREDVMNLLRLKDPFTVITGFDRKNLSFKVRKPKAKFPALLEVMERNRGKSGIVYCSTRKTVEEVCEKLNSHGFPAARYHAGLSDDERRTNQDDFLYDRKTVMVATNAFGMGIDKSNVSFVVHYNMPKNIENYYQEAGRAGRDGESAECVLLYSGQDVRTNLFFIENNHDADEGLPEENRQAVRERDRERLKAMAYYCATTDCLREYILRYFGENAPNFCGNCSNCVTDFETADITIDAQKIVSCVFRLAQRSRTFGKTMIADILHGAKNEKIRRLELDTLSTYGIMADVPVRKIRTIMDFLIHNNYLLSSAGEYPVVTLSPRSAEIIREKKTVEIKLAKYTEPEKTPQKQDFHAVNDELFAILKTLRNRLALEAHVPAYIVFPDAALRDMCVKLPRTPEEFLEISGVGKAKMERYGEAFTGIIREYAAQVFSENGKDE